MSDSASEIDEKELVRIIGGTIDDMKEFVEEKNPDRQLLKKLLEDEKVAKDRKTAKQYLEKKIKEKEVGGEFTRARDEIEDVQNTLERIREEEIGDRDFSGEETGEVNSVEEIDLLEGDYEDVEQFLKERNPSVEIARELREGEEKAQDRKNVKELLERYARQKKLYKDIKNAEYHIGKIREDFAEIEEESEYISGDLKVERPHEAVKEEHGEEDREEEDEEADTAEKASEEAATSETGASSDEEDEVEEDGELEEKKALLEQLDVDMSEEKLKDIDKEQLEQLRDEKSERQRLIEDLEEIGMEEEELKDSSTEDLRKLREEMVGDDEDEASEEESDKDEEKIEEEAEEDLEMLMGSAQTSEKEEEGSDPLNQLKEIKSKFKEAWNTPEREEEEEEEGIDGEKVVGLLDRYEDLPEKEQAIKTAHVMKGYLEYQMDIEREMTYEELAETLGEVENPSENLEVLKMFFKSMAEDQYLDRIEVENMEQVNYSSREIVEELG